MELTVLLNELGLEHQESAVYLAAMRLGTSAASIIAKRVDIPRSTARYTCEQLVKKQLMIETQKGNTKLFTAESPEKLQKLLDLQQESIDIRQQKLDVALQDLKRLYNPMTVLPKVRFYEGREGIINLYNSILDLNAPIVSFEEKGEMARFIPKYIHEFIEQRIARGISSRVIVPASNKVIKTYSKEFGETKFVDDEIYPFTGDVKICQDLVSIFSFDQNTAVGIAIQNQDIANNFRVLFELIWGKLDVAS